VLESVSSSRLSLAKESPGPGLVETLMDAVAGGFLSPQAALANAMDTRTTPNRQFFCIEFSRYLMGFSAGDMAQFSDRGQEHGLTCKVHT
jgi:hypothetical protein